MISFQKFVLNNGLTLIVHEDESTPLVACNLLYQVGSKNENPDRTGFAHLFEHLMFSGSENIKDFDTVIQNSGGENNAFTNNDITNFYEILPAENIETALWLESDRMRELTIDQVALDVQKKVVVEEFKETCLNAPYGDAWHHISEMAYKDHPYQWPTIGKVPEHISDASLQDVQNFYQKHYTPDNAILVIAGNISAAKAQSLTEKWFGDIAPAKEKTDRISIKEPEQYEYRQKQLRQAVPVRSMYQAFHMPERLHDDYYACDILSDVLGSGRSSRFYQRLHKDKKLFSSIDAYISGYQDQGLFIIEAKLYEDVDMDQAKAEIWVELEQLKSELLKPAELEKLKNKVESTLIFSEVNVLNKAMNLAYYEHIGDANLINDQSERYQKVSVEDIQRVAQNIFRRDNCSELSYLPK